MNALGPGSLLVFFAVVTVLQALYTLHRMRFAAQVPAAAKAGYVVTGGSSQAALKLDPRATADRHAPRST